MNLLKNDWIPVTDSNGLTRRISLREAFERGREVRDFACGPAERVSLLRLLICVAQASQDSPPRDDSPDWEKFESDLIPAALAYLGRKEITSAFELFGAGQRFLQVRTPKTETMATSKLVLHMASGGNPTHNDHGGGDERSMAPTELALALLSFQNFSPLLGRGYTGRGLCVEGNAAHAFQCGPNLAATIAANCLSLDAIHSVCPEEKLGRPVWELPPAPPFSPNDLATRNATHSYLGRLVPVSRAVWLLDSANVILSNGPQFPLTPAVREASTSVVASKKNEHILLSLRLGRAVWRDLPALTATRAGGCATLRRGSSEDREIFVGGLVTDYKAKIEDSVASTFAGRLAVPVSLFATEDAARDARLDYAAAISAAEAWEKSLWLALGSYFKTLKVDPKQTADFRSAAQARFWNLVERAVPTLFDLLRAPDSFPEDPLDHPYAATAWHRAIRDASSSAYRLHTMRGNARQLEAFTLGLKSLWPKNPSKTKAV